MCGGGVCARREPPPQQRGCPVQGGEIARSQHPIGPPSPRSTPLNSTFQPFHTISRFAVPFTSRAPRFYFTARVFFAFFIFGTEYLRHFDGSRRGASYSHHLSPSHLEAITSSTPGREKELLALLCGAMPAATNDGPTVALSCMFGNLEQPHGPRTTDYWGLTSRPLIANSSQLPTTSGARRTPA